MSLHVWATLPEDAFKILNRRDREAEALLAWATWTAEAGQYLATLDDHAFAEPHRRLFGFPIDRVEMGHVRWAAGNAITALDLCAAVLGRLYFAPVGLHEHDVRSLGKADKKDSRLPVPAKGWLAQVNTDQSYKLVSDARNPLVHRRLLRKTSAGGIRADFVAGSTTIAARELILLSTDVAIRHVELCLAGIAAGLF
jgi:hypothetical protein